MMIKVMIKVMIKKEMTRKLMLKKELRVIKRKVMLKKELRVIKRKVMMLKEMVMIKKVMIQKMKVIIKNQIQVLVMVKNKELLNSGLVMLNFGLQICQSMSLIKMKALVLMKMLNQNTQNHGELTLNEIININTILFKF